MPRMKAFQGPLFPLQTAHEINLEDVEKLLEIANEKLTVVNDGLGESNRILHDTHVGHEFSLWGHAVHDGDYEPPEE